MEPLQPENVPCPYCGETVLLLLDLSSGGQEYVEDCAVCCRPMNVDVRPNPDGSFRAAVRREDD